eukprot:2897756-Rhodomonas_salina.4
MTHFSGKPRLSTAAVMQIYAVRPARSPQDQTFVPCTAFTHEVALHFDICDRTVRDIWNRRAWRQTTRPAWSPEEIAADAAASSILFVAPVLSFAAATDPSADMLVFSTTQADDQSEQDPSDFLPASSSSQTLSFDSSQTGAHTEQWPSSESSSAQEDEPSEQDCMWLHGDFSTDQPQSDDKHATASQHIHDFSDADYTCSSFTPEDSMAFQKALANLSEDPFWEDWVSAMTAVKRMARCRAQEEDDGELFHKRRN